MLAARCPRCAAEHALDARFCTRCGLALRADAAGPGDSGSAEPRFVTCRACGAPNAASRQRCGRCKTPFAADAADVPPPTAAATTAGATPGAQEPVEAAERGLRLVFGAAITLAALAIVAVIATLLTGNGVGFLAGASERGRPADGDVPLDVASVRASSVLPAEGARSHEPELLLDGDPATVWLANASGSGQGEWVELELAGTPQVSRLLLWNGDQREGRFRASTRAGEVRIDLGERTFTADLLDVPGPQAVELPEQVSASSLRLTVLEVVLGSGGLALSGLEVRGPLPTDPDVGS